MPPGPNGGPPPGAKPPMKKNTRNWLLIGGGVAALAVVYYVMKSRSSASGIDPATGIPYDQEYSAAGAGAGPVGATPSLYGYIDPTTGAFISGAGAPGLVTAPSTNASWAQQVEAYLQNLGYDPIGVAAAIGKYLTGQTLSQQQADIVRAALGFFGNPPQGAPPISQGPPPVQGPGGSRHRTRVLTVKKNETLRQYAREHNWTNLTLRIVEWLNHLKPGSRLHKGERIIRPIGDWTDFFTKPKNHLGSKPFNVPPPWTEGP